MPKTSYPGNPAIIPSRMAFVAASVRFSAPSFSMILLMWVFAVAGEMWIMAAI